MLAKKCGAVKEGHFLLTSGLHSGVYVEKFHLLEYPEILSEFVEALLPKLEGPFDRVVGPALGGMIVAYEVASQLGIPASYAEKGPDEEFVIRRGHGVSKGERVLVVDDVMTTGGSVRKTIAAVRERGGEIARVGVLVDRAADPPRDFSYVSALRYILPAYKPEECPLCAKDLPLLRLGGSS
ncbi:orotate phosphoribosyltransferase [candidate division TA06 bacterium B3_TA06]|uniref:Orotate phosphoribosyltransferase n=1 Tax=candidate division TA06 bacterium B3_TA06 TaxID=2012487 RepID=A0A532VBA1_UNCT6|nr:MAG: orotate phosphoribosyltransferase [candidate division TA06 bacterium B3_TA06]